jgi:hypothetical protein
VTNAQLACPPCDARYARKIPDAEVDAVVRAQLAIEIGKPCGQDDPSCSRACLCEIQQVQQVQGANPQEALRVCRQDLDAPGVEGWCYVDDSAGSNPELVANCPATQRRLLRFVGSGLGANTTTFVACTGSSFAARE